MTEVAQRHYASDVFRLHSEMLRGFLSQIGSGILSGACIAFDVDNTIVAMPPEECLMKMDEETEGGVPLIARPFARLLIEALQGHGAQVLLYSQIPGQGKVDEVTTAIGLQVRSIWSPENCEKLSHHSQTPRYQEQKKNALKRLQLLRAGKSRAELSPEEQMQVYTDRIGFWEQTRRDIFNIPGNELERLAGMIRTDMMKFPSLMGVDFHFDDLGYLYQLGAFLLGHTEEISRIIPVPPFGFSKRELFSRHYLDIGLISGASALQKKIDMCLGFTPYIYTNSDREILGNYF